METVVASWQEGTFRFISQNRQIVLSKPRSAVDMKDFFLLNVEVDSSFCRMNIRLLWGLLLMTKVSSFGHINDQRDEIAQPRCVVCYSRYLWRIVLLNLLPIDFGLTNLTGLMVKLLTPFWTASCSTSNRYSLTCWSCKKGWNVPSALILLNKTFNLAEERLLLFNHSGRLWLSLKNKWKFGLQIEWTFTRYFLFLGGGGGVTRQSFHGLRKIRKNEYVTNL